VVSLRSTHGRKLGEGEAERVLLAPRRGVWQKRPMKTPLKAPAA
jgi:hypothetical protein